MQHPGAFLLTQKKFKKKNKNTTYNNTQTKTTWILDAFHLTKIKDKKKKKKKLTQRNGNLLP